jgi:hypothetical protein
MLILEFQITSYVFTVRKVEIDDIVTENNKHIKDFLNCNAVPPFKILCGVFKNKKEIMKYIDDTFGSTELDYYIKEI